MVNMSNSEFKSELQKRIGESSNLRPFICDGYPLECEIFIIGINPATSSDTNFFGYWNGNKFDKERWFAEYKNERKAKGKKEISLTRKKIEMLVNEVFSDFKCLETNAYSVATPDVNSLNKNDKNTDVLSFLLDTIKPKALFIHGRKPVKFIEKKLGIKFTSSEPVIYKNMVICATKHLNLIKEEKIKKVGEQLISEIKKLK